MIYTNVEIHLAHVDKLMQVTTLLASWLTEEGAKVADQGCRFALQTTLIKASTRLDAVLDDEARWALPEVDAKDIALRDTVIKSRAAETRVIHERALVQ